MTLPGAASAWRLRLPALACVAALVLGVRALAPDPGVRRASLLIFALGLGYGHQLGALAFARRRRRAVIERLLVGSVLVTLGVAFAVALASEAAASLLIALALLAAWHVLENDLALGRARVGSRRLPPLPRVLGAHLAPVGAAAAVVAVAWLAPRLAPKLVGAGVPVWLATWTPEEVIAVLLLYHSAIWLGRGMAASAGARAPTARHAAILLLHALPLLALAGAREIAPLAFAFAASPPIYLFLSAAHAVHTCLERGLEPG